MKQLLFSFFLLLIATQSYAQEEVFNFPAIDTTRFVCQYDYTYPSPYTDTRTIDMRLEIGLHLSKFYSYGTLKYFLMQTTPEGKAKLKEMTQDVFNRSAKATNVLERTRIMNQLPGREEDIIIYKNYPKDSLYIQDSASGTEFMYYTEPYLGQNWEIQTDTLTILGFHCQKATCTWRGRDYEAWFTTEIPTNDGPMKFSGLPGLIVKVTDTDQDYRLELKGIENIKKPIYFNNKTFLKNSPDFLPITRKELLKRKQKIFQSQVRMLKRTLKSIGKSTDDINEDKYNCLEKDYNQ